MFVNQRVWLGSDLMLHSSKKLRRSCQHACLRCLKKLCEHEGQALATYHFTVLEIYAVISTSHLLSRPPAPPENYTVFMGCLQMPNTLLSPKNEQRCPAR